MATSLVLGVVNELYRRVAAIVILAPFLLLCGAVGLCRCTE